MPFTDKTTLNKVDTLSPFRHWCQKVLPAVYDDSLSYYELLCKVVDYLNKTMENVNELNENVNKLYDAYKQLVEFVNEFEELVKQRLDAQDTKIKAMEQKIDAFIAEMNEKFDDFEQEMRAFIEEYTATAVKNEFTAYVNSEVFSDILDDKVESALGGSGIQDSLDLIEQETSGIGDIIKTIGSPGDTGGSSASGTVMSKLNAIIASGGGGGGGGGSAEINVESLVQNMGDTRDTGATNESGTVFGKLNKIIDNTEGTSEGETTIKNNIGSTDDTVGTATSGTLFGKMNTALKNLTNLLTSTGATGDSAGSATAGSLFAKLNKTITDLSDIKSYTTTNNTASETGVLSQKLSSIIDYVKTNNTASSTGTLSQKLSYLITNGSSVSALNAPTYGALSEKVGRSETKTVSLAINKNVHGVGYAVRTTLTGGSQGNAAFTITVGGKTYNRTFKASGDTFTTYVLQNVFEKGNTSFKMSTDFYLYPDTAASDAQIVNGFFDKIEMTVTTNEYTELYLFYF